MPLFGGASDKNDSSQVDNSDEAVAESAAPTSYDTDVDNETLILSKIEGLERAISTILEVVYNYDERLSVLIELMANGNTFNVEVDSNDVQDMRILVEAYDDLLKQVLTYDGFSKDTQEGLAGHLSSLGMWKSIMNARNRIATRHEKRGKLQAPVPPSDEKGT